MTGAEAAPPPAGLGHRLVGALWTGLWCAIAVTALLQLARAVLGV
jgi:hypothetical protein